MAYNAGKNLTLLYVKDKKNLHNLGKKNSYPNEITHTPPPPLPPEKVNLYTESVFLLASVMVKINSVKSWWGKGLHLPSAGLLVQTRKNSKKQKRKNSRFTIQLFATKLFEYSLFFLKQKKSKFIIFSQTNLFFQQKARLSLQMMVTSARKK